MGWSISAVQLHIKQQLYLQHPIESYFPLLSYLSILKG